MECMLSVTQGGVPAAAQTLGEISAWASSAALLSLVVQYGGVEPTGSLHDRLAYLDDFAAATWDFRRRAGQSVLERNQMDRARVNSQDEPLILSAVEQLGMMEPHRPLYCRYDYVIVLGGLVWSNLARASYAAHLVRNELSAGTVTGLTSYRNLARVTRDSERDEPTVLRALGLPACLYECEVLEAALCRVFGLPRLDTHTAGHLRRGSARYRIASASVMGLKIRLVAAPLDSASGKGRVDTATALRFWASSQVLRPRARVLLVTTHPYSAYQHLTALQHLAYPLNVEVETVGVDYGALDQRVLGSQLRAVDYLQELRALIGAGRRLTDALIHRSSHAAAG